MREIRFEKWKDVWERKGKEKSEQKLTLQDLIKMDGFDKGAGRMTEEVWLWAVEIVKRELALQKGDSLLEVGCGSGAMLLPLSGLEIKLSGVDYSSSLIGVARKIVPQITAEVAEAAELPFSGSMFDKVLSHGVFHYFPHYSYAERALDEMIRVARNKCRVLVMDVPDIDKKHMSEKSREEAALEGGSAYLTSGDYSHLYYAKIFFEDFASKNDLRVKIFEQKIQGYGNSPFRFNVLFVRG